MPTVHGKVVLFPSTCWREPLKEFRRGMMWWDVLFGRGHLVLCRGPLGLKPTCKQQKQTGDGCSWPLRDDGGAGWAKGAVVRRGNVAPFGICFINSSYSVWPCWVATKKELVEVVIKWLLKNHYWFCFIIIHCLFLLFCDHILRTLKVLLKFFGWMRYSMLSTRPTRT